MVQPSHLDSVPGQAGSLQHSTFVGVLQPTAQPDPHAHAHVQHPRRQRRGAAGGNAAEAADAALGRFTDFLARHENELQPRTRQVYALTPETQRVGALFC